MTWATKPYGKKFEYEPDFKGPRGRESRQSTDKAFLYAFLFFLASWGVLGLYAYMNGDIGVLLSPTDSEGRICGHDPEVVDKEKLFSFDLSESEITAGKTAPQVCVKACPQENWSADMVFYGFAPRDWSLIQKKLICTTPQAALTVNSIETLLEVIDKDLCAKNYIQSHSILNRCIPTSKDIEDASLFMRRYNIAANDVTKGVMFSEQVKTELVKLFQDLDAASSFIVWGTVVSLLVTVFYIVLLRWTSGVIIWTSLIAFIALLFLALCVSLVNFVKLLNEPNPYLSIDNFYSSSDQIPNYNPDAFYWMSAAIAAGFVLLFMVLVIVCSRERIKVTIALVKEGSKAIESSLSSLIFPIVPWLLHIVVILWAGLVFLYLSSLGFGSYEVKGLSNSTDCMCLNSYQDGDRCTIKEWNQNCQGRLFIKCYDASCEYSASSTNSVILLLHAVNVFGLCWGIEFITGFSQMVLASIFATWYWTLDKRRVPFFLVFESIKRTVRFHLGTVAFGSLLITILMYVKICIRTIQRTCERHRHNPIARLILWSFSYLFSLLEVILRLISRNAYVMCAVHGTNFIRSAKDGFGLLSRNVVGYVVVRQVMLAVFFIGKLLITGIMVSMAYGMLLSNEKLFISLNYPHLPIVFIGFFAFLIASVFFSVFSFAIDTLYLCFCEDEERNDGTPERPYYMSESLRRVLNQDGKKTTLGDRTTSEMHLVTP